MIELENIGVVSGVNTEGKPFVTVTATGTDRTLMIGQLDPDTVRTMALHWLTAANGAELDAALVDVLGATPQAAEVVTRLREIRGI